MAFISSAKLLLRFNDLTLVDTVSADSFSINGGTSATFRSDNSGMVMERDKYIYMDSASLSITNKFSIGYWLTPTWPGMIQDPVTGVLDSLKINVFDIGNGSVSGGDVTITTPLFSMQEETLDGEILRVSLNIGNGAYTATTPGIYNSTDSHHFWIAYDGTVPSLTLYIDGHRRDFNATGTVPASLSGSSPIVSINRMMAEDDETVNNKGIIDEFVILNDAITDLSSIQKIINQGVDSVIDDQLASFVESEYSIMFDDPSAVRVNGAFNDGSYVYIARSDGRISRGTPKLWQSRREYSNPSELEDLKDSDSINIVNGFLKIDSGNVSL